MCSRVRTSHDVYAASRIIYLYCTRLVPATTTTTERLFDCTVQYNDNSNNNHHNDIYIYVCAHYNKGETRSGRPPSHPRFPRVRSHKHTHMRAYINIYINIHLYTCTRAHTYMYIKVSMPWCPEQGRERTRALALEYYQR